MLLLFELLATQILGKSFLWITRKIMRWNRLVMGKNKTAIVKFVLQIIVEFYLPLQKSLIIHIS